MHAWPAARVKHEVQDPSWGHLFIGGVPKEGHPAQKKYLFRFRLPGFVDGGGG